MNNHAMSLYPVDNKDGMNNLKNLVGESHQKLLEVFRKYSNNNFIFVKPGGNYGDYLIWKGAEKLAEQANISYVSYTHDDFMKRKIESKEIVYVHGGGGFNRFWQGTPILELTKAIQEHIGPTILGPQTILDDENYIKEVIKKIFHKRLSKDVYFFVRERTSYSLLKELLPRDVYLGIVPDTAFAIVKEDLMVPECYESKGYTLYAIRQDKESGKQYQRPNPFVFWLDPVLYAKDFKSWVQIHNNANTVFTDRTHSAIVSTLLGKKVYFLPNKYHKNRSIWEYSLKDRGVHWLEELKPNPLLGVIQKKRLYRRVVNSHMLKNFLRKYYARDFTK